jgi:hypothetical protein
MIYRFLVHQHRVQWFLDPRINSSQMWFWFVIVLEEVL